MPTKAETLQAVVKCPRLPAPPAITMQIIRAIDGGEADMPAVASLVSRDASLSAMVLRLANSAMFAAPLPASSLPQACARLGLREVRAAVINRFVVDGLAAVKPKQWSSGEYWQRILATSIASRLLAAAVKDGPADEAMTAGLLCDLGIGVLAYSLPAAYEQVLARARREAETPLHRIEADLLGVDHAEVGATLMQLWKIGPEVVFAVRHHHDFLERCDDPAWLPRHHVVAAGALLAESLTGALQFEAVDALFRHLAPLTSHPDEWVHRVLPQIESELTAAATAFNVDLGDLGRLGEAARHLVGMVGGHAPA